MDDWVVDAVAQENQSCSDILKVLKQSIQSEQIRIEDYQCQLSVPSLFDQIQTIQFSSSSTPLYLQNIHVPTDDHEACRFKVKDLEQLYTEVRFNVGEQGSINTLDQQSFINTIQLALRQGRVPLTWKYHSFESFSQWSSRFNIKPLEGIIGNDQPTQYQS